MRLYEEEENMIGVPMKKLLLTGVAALFLATGAAHAGPFYKWQCGEYRDRST